METATQYAFSATHTSTPTKITKACFRIRRTLGRQLHWLRVSAANTTDPVAGAVRHHHDWRVPRVLVARPQRFRGTRHCPLHSISHGFPGVQLPHNIVYIGNLRDERVQRLAQYRIPRCTPLLGNVRCKQNGVQCGRVLREDFRSCREVKCMAPAPYA